MKFLFSISSGTRRALIAVTVGLGVLGLVVSAAEPAAAFGAPLTPSRSADTVRFGDRGPVVARIQRALSISADGIFGQQTRAAVVSFQRARGLQVDGVVGPQTAGGLAGTLGGALVKTGSRGAAVARIQRALSIPADGVFGPQTRSAVERFQRATALQVDGIVGLRTAGALFADVTPPRVTVPGPQPPAPSGGSSGAVTHGRRFDIDTNLRRPSGMSAPQLEAFVRARHPNSPFIRDGAYFIEAERRYGVNAQYLLAHAIEESDWGLQPIKPFNYFGFRAFDSCPAACAASFASARQGILAVAAFIARQYLTRGGRWFVSPTLRGMNVHYATDRNWSRNIASIADDM